MFLFLRAGIIGLYTAYILTTPGQSPGPAHDPALITVVAEYLPGDLSVDYTSPFAGANFSTVSADTPRARAHDKASFIGLKHLYRLHGAEAGVQMMRATEYYVEGSSVPSQAKLEDMKSYIDDLKVLEKRDLPGDKVAGITFTTLNFNSPKLLNWLKKTLELRGVTFVRRKLGHIDEAFGLAAPGTPKPGPVVFNCTGLGARSLPGVQDPLVYPTRGQVVVVRAPHLNQNFSLDGPVFTTYVIPRPYSDGHVVLGGYMQAGNADGSTYGFETQSILARVQHDLLSAHGGGGGGGGGLHLAPYEIVREVAGLRPSREGGVRIEREERARGLVIHNYGAGGTGYQSGYGMALEAVSLLQEPGSKGSDKGKL